MTAGTTRALLKDIISKRVIVHASDEIRIVGNHSKAMHWIFDFRSALLDGEFLSLIAELFWEECGSKYPFQVGGLETASIPMIAAIVLKGRERGTPVNGFYIRKSRKQEGLQKIIEGKITDDPIILVDDLINGGITFNKQIEILGKENKKPICLFAVVRFRELEEFIFAKEKGIEIIAPLSLKEFGLDVNNKNPLPDRNAFTVQWMGQGPTPNYFYRMPKSAPAIDTENVYFGSDDGMMRALRQEDGEIVWEFKILGFGTQGKTIFSAPALYDNTVYFGAYDGNFYALDAKTGKKRWINMDADWIGSSPCVAEDLGLVYVGLEFGLFTKKGGIVALDAKTGKKRWEYITMPELTHGSPAYSKKFNMVAIGSNDGAVYCFRATDGKLLWRQQTAGEVKASLAFDEKRGYLIFGSHDGAIYILNVKDGSDAFLFPTGVSIYSTPLVEGDYVYASALDKKIYCINLNTFDVEWSFETTGRVFASPLFVDGRIYVGSNDGRLYELDARTGKYIGFFQATERITNKVAYNATTKRFFMLTYANEMYCLEKTK